MHFTDRAYWLTTREYSPSPAVASNATADVAIVGGGYTGLSTAYHLKKLDPALRVVLLEGEVIGFGASGRNGGFAMTLFGLTMQLTKLRFGREQVLQAHRYMEQAVDYVGQLVEEHGLDCEYERPGFLRAATSERYAKRIRHELKLAHSLGIRDVEWIDEQTVRGEVNSPMYLGAWWEPRCALVNPAKLAWEMKRLCEELGVEVFENSPVAEISRTGDSFMLKVGKHEVAADRLALATNAYSDAFPQLRRKQIPVFTRIVLTEPLGDKLKSIGWANRQGIEDARNLIHYYRLTSENRLLMGGGDVGLPYGGEMELDRDEGNFRQLEDQVRELFPVLSDAAFTHRWGGPVSVTADFAPALGYIGNDRKAVYSVGCAGHGVSMTQYNGWTLAELLLEQSSNRTGSFFVNRRVIRWPAEPVRYALGYAIRGYMRTEDKWYDP